MVYTIILTYDPLGAYQSINYSIIGLLKGTATLTISIFYNTEVFKPWVLIPVSSKSVEKLGCYGFLKISKWLTLSRHFENLIRFSEFS